MSVIDKFRYKYDITDAKDYTAESRDLRSHILSNSIRISPEIFPEIYEKINETILSLSIPEVYEFFITPNNDFNAFCFSINTNECVIVINSRVLDLLSTDELMFIIGHEIGHHYYSHPSLSINDQSINKKTYLTQLCLSRNMEITCDRLGLAAIKKFDTAAKAILKIVSGLNDKYINNNFDTYLHQLKELKHIGIQDDKYQTHNNWLLRLQALKLFSNSREYTDFLGESKSDKLPLKDIDDIISDGLDRFVGVNYNDLVKSNTEKFFIWMSSYIILMINPSCKSELHDKLSINHDSKRVNKLIKYLLSSDQASVKKKLNEYAKEAQSLPTSVKHTMAQDIIVFVNEFCKIPDDVQSTIFVYLKIPVEKN